MSVPLWRPLALLSVALGTLPVSGLTREGGPVGRRLLSWPSAAALPPLLIMVVMPVVSVYLIFVEKLAEYKGVKEINPFSVAFNMSMVVAPVLLLFVAQWMKAGRIAELLRACAALREASARVNDRRWLGAAMTVLVVGEGALILWCTPGVESWKLATIASAGIYGKLLRVLVLWQMLSILLEIGDRLQDVCRLMEEPAETDCPEETAAHQQVLHGGLQTPYGSRRGSVCSEYSHCSTWDIPFPASNGLSATKALPSDPPEPVQEPFSGPVCCSCYSVNRRAKHPRQPTSRPCFETATTTTITITTNTSPMARIQLLRHRHAAAAHVVGLFNAAFGVQMVLLMVFSFGMAVGVVLPEYGYLSVERRVPVTVTQIGMGLINIGSLCLAGQRVANEARRPLMMLGLPEDFGSGGSQIQRETQLETQLERQLETRLETVQATLQLQSAERDISAAGMFHVNSGTLLSLVAALVTYGVILQQVTPASAHGKAD